MLLKDIKGIGPKLYIKLKENGIDNIQSLIFTFPKKYIEYKLTNLLYDDVFNIKATIIDDVKIQRTSRVTKLTFECLIDDLRYSCVAFNMQYLSKTLSIGDEIVIIGTYNKNYKQIQVNKILKLESYKEGIVPEYNLEGISDAKFQKIVLEAIKFYAPKISIIPEEYYNKYDYKIGKELLLQIHSPKKQYDYINAIRALKYHELLTFSLKMEIIRKNVNSLYKEKKNYDLEKVKAFIELGIRFELTQDQKNAVNDIFKFFNSDVPLNMLLEGDVGSGKTIVAIISSYAVTTAGYQSLMIVPTESLANQHYNSFRNYLEPFGVNVEMLTSSTSAKQRKEILKKLDNGSIDIVIGTTSLLNDEVKFSNLGFVVCDEQHKFGVEQRKKIKEKGNNPDTLYMTATPIPRTLALAFFNDFTLEFIKTMPNSRKGIKTYAHTYKDYTKILDFIKSEINDGRQAYFVAPAIDDNKDSSITPVLKIKEDLEKYYMGLRIGLLHGRLSSKEKEEVLLKFKNKELDILASTTVIEVGIDNPNASCMVIIDANHFGLAQLHQLRGRVGRGEFEGYTFLMVENKEYLERLKILEETVDGFLISEADLKDRGPGDFLGTSQSGMLKFTFADIVKDNDILLDALKDSKQLIKKDSVRLFFESNLESLKFD